MADHPETSYEGGTSQSDQACGHFDYDVQPEIMHGGTHVRLTTGVVGEVMKALMGIHSIVTVLTGDALANEEERDMPTLSIHAAEGLRLAVDALAVLSSRALSRELQKAENYFGGPRTAA